MEATWLFKVGMTEVQERCIRLFVQIARKSAKFLLIPEETVQFTAKNAIQNEKIAAVKRNTYRRKNLRFLRLRERGS